MRKYKTTTQQAWISVPDKLRGQCSRSCLQSVINGFKKMQRSRDSLLLPFAQLQKLDDTDTDIDCKNIIDRYAARPQILENMSLAEFEANYTYKQETHNNMMEDKDEISEESDREFRDNNNHDNDNNMIHTSVITLQNGLGSMRKRKRKAIIR